MRQFALLLMVLLPVWGAILITLACIGVPRRRKPSELERTLANMEKGE